KKLGGIDEETLQAISDGLSTDDEQTSEKQSIDMDAEPAGADESPWDPVPLTPGRKIDSGPTPVMSEASLGALDEHVTNQPTLSSAPVPTAAEARARKKTPPPPAEAREKPPSSTLLGLTAPEHQSLLVPSTPRGLYDSTENTNSVTREWKQTPTG